MEVICSPEILVMKYKTKQFHNLEDHNQHLMFHFYDLTLNMCTQFLPFKVLPLHLLFQYISLLNTDFTIHLICI
jgi:hypothetical protein